MQPRKYAFAYAYALRAYGDSYDVFTTAGVFRNVKGNLVRACYGGKEIAWLSEQDTRKPMQTYFYVCAGTALSFLREKGDCDLAEKERRATQKRLGREAAQAVELAEQGVRRLMAAVRKEREAKDIPPNLLDKAVAACIV
jgi:hypothetical protein